MPRRPDLNKASLLAGLICLCVCLAAPGWGEPGKDPFARTTEDRVAVQSPPRGQPASLQLAQRVGPPQPPAQKSGSSPSGSGRFLDFLVRFFAGGVLGPLLWHYVFGYPLAAFWQNGIWPPGLLDLVVALTIGHLGYRQCRQWADKSAPPPPKKSRSFLRPENRIPASFSVDPGAEPGLAAITAVNPEFNLQAFAVDVQQLLQEVYTGWNLQNVEGLSGKVKDGLLDYLRMGLKIMSLREELSHLEDLNLENIAITAAGIHDGQEFITVRFRGWLMDYVLDQTSGKLLAGSMAYPNIFLEFWELGRVQGQTTWVLQDIRER